MRLSLAQIDSGTDKGRNLGIIAHRVRDAADAGADLVVFPEYSMYEKKVVDATFSAAAERLDGPFVDGLRALAADTGLTIVAGIVEVNPDDARPFNTLVAIGPGGHIRARYRKIHLFDSFGFRESDNISPSDGLEPVVFDVDGATVGLMTCYDLRFPELARGLGDAGAELMLACSSWVPGNGKVDQWTVLARARAIENACFFGGVSQLPPVSIGHSVLVDPMGGVIGELGTEPGSWTFDIDIGEVASARELNPASRGEGVPAGRARAAGG